MTQFMLAHPWLFTVQVAFACLAVCSVGISLGGKVDTVNHNYYYQQEGNKREN